MGEVAGYGFTTYMLRSEFEPAGRTPRWTPWGFVTPSGRTGRGGVLDWVGLFEFWCGCVFFMFVKGVRLFGFIIFVGF